MIRADTYYKIGGSHYFANYAGSATLDVNRPGDQALARSGAI